MSAITPVDRDVLTALRAGEEAAFVALVDRHGPALARVARSLSPNRAPGVVPAAWPTPGDGLLAGELRGVLTGAIDALPPAQRTVIGLRDVEGWSAGRPARRSSSPRATSGCSCTVPARGCAPRSRRTSAPSSPSWSSGRPRPSARARPRRSPRPERSSAARWASRCSGAWEPPSTARAFTDGMHVVAATGAAGALVTAVVAGGAPTSPLA